LLSQDVHAAKERKSSQVVAQILATAWIWALNISVQPVQAGIRALIIDSVPVSQQVQAAAYASCVVAVGSILGYSSGFLVLPVVAPWLGNTQFKGLSVIASLALGSTAAITCLTIKEEVVGSGRKHSKGKNTLFGTFVELLVSVKSMPQKIMRVFMVQFFAWLGWFPFLFYITT
jgi:solute carrier family 45 protein 1/2/4